MSYLLQNKNWGVFLVFAIFSISASLAQIGPDIYRVEFVDKNSNAYSLIQPQEFLSERSLERKLRYGIAIDSTDLPLTEMYLDSIKTYEGINILARSKWFNSIVVRCTDTTLLDSVHNISFVKSITKKSVSTYKLFKDSKTDSLELKSVAVDNMGFNSVYGLGWDQISLNNGQYLHQSGYTGSGMLIAVIDAGFKQLPSIELLHSLWEKGQIIDVRDFVELGEGNIYLSSDHGTRVLSVIGSDNEDLFVGTAPGASFVLLRSEDTRSEYPVEEEYWISAAEFADSIGVDVINSSLGYSIFTDTSLNYTYQDMNGITTCISRAADMAMNKGMLVVTSAGNSGNSPWKYITAPADAKLALAIGAVDKDGIIADFSGRGPSFDQRIKPDVCAVGKNTYSINASNQVTAGNGTSFSAPIISGLSACLWQAFPQFNAVEIADAIRQSCDHYEYPDTITGYGIPDFFTAFQILGSKSGGDFNNTEVCVYPNPVVDYFMIQITSVETVFNLVFTLYDLNGRLLVENQFKPNTNYLLEYINVPGSVSSGFYLYSIRINSQDIFNGKLCIIKNK